ncbi:MAG: hypothetical protein ACJ75E_11700, partial [Actinomycetes bacterium]
DHQYRLAKSTSDLPHRPPDLVELAGTTNQAALRVGVDTSSHRDASLNHLWADGTPAAEH